MTLIDTSVSELYVGDCRELLKRLPPRSVQTCITSPPYLGLRDYGVAGQIGLESSVAAYVAELVGVFRLVRDALCDDGTLWLNLGDAYAATTKGSGGTNSTTIGHGKGQATNEGSYHANRKWQIPHGCKPKDLIGLPWEVAFALRADGWYLRSDIIWHKPNPMPESVTDRPTKSHEYLFLLSKSERYFYDADAIAEPLDSDPTRWGRHTKKDPGAQALRSRPMFGDERGGRDGTEFGNGSTRNKRSVWTVATTPYDGAHFATFPPALIEPCVLAGAPVGGVVLDPFFGSGTTGAVAEKHGRKWIGFDLNPKYAELAKGRTAQRSLLGLTVAPAPAASAVADADAEPGSEGAA